MAFALVRSLLWAWCRSLYTRTITITAEAQLLAFTVIILLLTNHEGSGKLMRGRRIVTRFNFENS
jgi:hypothetical protein